MTGNGLGQGLSDMWRSVLLFVPAALAFVAILVAGYLVARVLRTLVTKGLRRAGFDKAVDRGPVGRALSGQVSATDVCAKIVFYGVLLFALQLAFGIWGPNPVSDLLTALIAWLPRLLVAIVIVVVASAIAGAVHDLIASALGGLPYGRMLARVAAAVIVALGVIAALDQVRIATSVTQPLLIAVLATVAGILIVGVGGGLVRPMQHRWETWLERASAESSNIREHAKAYAAAQSSSPAPAPDVVAEPHGPEETQVITPRRSDDPDATTVIRTGTADTTIVNPAADQTVVIGTGTEEGEPEKPAK
ncbi:mechanosensitive ion channel family protein [Actinoplanes sp. CA-030573]|uniref:mechanosensitive ion channel family protein n=1 Tax=Actinoplanes sp. CA-030573 TaxID=3239898 RepID=UPI003D8D16FF